MVAQIPTETTTQVIYPDRDGHRIDLAGWVRHEDRLESIEDTHNWISPRLGIRFNMQEDTQKVSGSVVASNFS